MKVRRYSPEKFPFRTTKHGNDARQGVQRALSTSKKRIDLETVDLLLAKLWSKGFKVVPIKRVKK